MPRRGPNGKCQVCKHAERSRIETLLATGARPRGVGERFGVHWAAVRRHWLRHTPPHVRAARAAHALKPGVELEKLVAEELSGLIEHLQNIRGKLYLLFDGAVEVGDRGGAALLSGRIHENLQLVAKLTGELMKHVAPNITNVMINPDVLEIMNAVRLAIAPYPEARAAIAAAFERIEARVAGRYAAPPPLAIEARPDAA